MLPRYGINFGLILLVIGIMYQCNSRILTPFKPGQAFSMGEELVGLIATKLPDCRVLILNNAFNFHYEVLESILALYPLPEVPTGSCNHSSLQFTVAIPHGRVPFQKTKSKSWNEYANTAMMGKNYYSYATEGQSRHLATVLQVPGRDKVGTDGFDYFINASCYCRLPQDLEWLQNSTSNFCVFHESCEEHKNSSQAMWLNPHHERHFFPSLLPRFEPYAGPKQNQDHHNLCVVGSPSRRNYDYVINYLNTLGNTTTDVHFHNFGWGLLPTSLDAWSHRVTSHSIGNYVEFQRSVVQTCDAIMPLLRPTTQPDYFTGAKKLSGSIVQAAAYKLPIVLHHDLAKLYESHIVDTVTHGDDQESYNDAIQRLLHRLEKRKK